MLLERDKVAVARTSISEYLRRVRSLVLAHEAARAAWYACAFLGALALVLPLAGLALGTHRATALAVLGLGGLVATIVVGGAVVVGVIVPRRRYARETELARWIGTRHGDVASDLLSAVELAAAPPRPGAPSRELVGALLEATGAQLEDVDPKTLVPRDETQRARTWALAALAGNLAMVVALPAVVRGGWRELVFASADPFDGAQLSAVPLVGDLSVTLTFPAYAHRRPLELPSSSGDVRGLPGTTVTLHSHVLVPATAVDMVIEAAGSTKTIAAKLDGDQVTAGLAIEHPARYRFEVTTPSGLRTIEATPRTIETEPDAAPTVQLLAPGEPLDVTNTRSVELAYVIEDDYGLASAELVWESGKDRGKKPIAIAADAPRQAQGKLTWDLGEIPLASGGEVRYWVEAKDTDNVGGPNVGRSRELHLRVTSPRERHEETLAREGQAAEKIIKNLGTRLVGLGDDTAAREELTRGLHDAVVDLGSIHGAYEKDSLASELSRKALAQMHDRLDKLQAAEQKLLPKAAKISQGRFAALDPHIITELEDDTLALADWLDRARLESLLDISDEIAAHQKRLADLLAEYARTKDPRLLDQIDREMRALDRAYAELERHQRGMPEDVLDQYVNRDGAHAEEESSCMSAVSALVHAGKTAEAQAKLETCQQLRQRRAGSLEGSLASLRGDKFGEEQHKLDEVMNELADVKKDQDDIASEANRLFEGYAQKADEVARDHRREASKKVGALIDKLRRRIDGIDEAGLTPFAKEELDIVERRLGDVEHMVADGDLAEGLGMARQAKQSLDTIASELDAALSDDPKSKWADATRDAIEGVERARPVAKDLIDELQALSPRPDQIMTPDDQRAFERLRRREAMAKQRTQRLVDRSKQLGGELPGDTSAALGKQLGVAIDHMGQADDRMKDRDPSGAREEARAAADALAKSRERAQSAARQAQQHSVDEPIRIPGADEYRAPEKYREELQEAWRKTGEHPPDGYSDMNRQYYEELIR
jgi:hypothetical protein